MFVKGMWGGVGYDGGHKLFIHFCGEGGDIW